jgi:hypothetical protein
LVCSVFIQAASAIEIKPRTVFSILPDSNLEMDEAFSLLKKEKEASSSLVPGGYTAKELINRYSDNLVAEAKQAGLPESLLRKALTHCPGELPYAVSYVKIKGRPYWLISTRKMDYYTSERVELTHGSNYLMDLKSPENFLFSSCYCF